MQTIAEKITIVQEIARQTDLLALERRGGGRARRRARHAASRWSPRKCANSPNAARPPRPRSARCRRETVKAAHDAGEMLTRLVPDIQRTAELVAEISAACREQDVGVAQINQPIQQLDQVTQQNASASEEMSATSEELAAQAEQLQSGIAYFHIDAHASAAPPVHTQVATAPDAKAHRPPVHTRPVAATIQHARPARMKAQSAAVATKHNGHAGTGVNLDLSSAEEDARDKEFVRGRGMPCPRHGHLKDPNDA